MYFLQNKPRRVWWSVKLHLCGACIAQVLLVLYSTLNSLILPIKFLGINFNPILAIILHSIFNYLIHSTTNDLNSRILPHIYQQSIQPITYLHDHYFTYLLSDFTTITKPNRKSQNDNCVLWSSLLLWLGTDADHSSLTLYRRFSIADLFTYISNKIIFSILYSRPQLTKYCQNIIFRTFMNSFTHYCQQYLS